MRVRPLLAHEIASADAPVLRVPDPTGLHAVVGRQGDKEVLRSYRFSSVCGPGTSQEAFFDSSGVRGLIDEALEGINCSVFAYGQVGRGYALQLVAAGPNAAPPAHPMLLQTGSGKTFSMSGLEERLAAHRGFRTVDASAGIIPRAVRYL